MNTHLEQLQAQLDGTTPAQAQAKVPIAVKKDSNRISLIISSQIEIEIIQYSNVTTAGFDHYCKGKFEEVPKTEFLHRLNELIASI